MRLYSTIVIRDDDPACLDGRPVSPNFSEINATTTQWLPTRFVNILITRKMHTFPVPYPSISSSDLKVTTLLCIPLLTCSNNQPTHQWDIHHHHHHRAEGFRVRARRRGVGVDAADYWRLGRLQGFGKLYAWFCRRLTDADMRPQTSLSRRRSSITVHPQSTVCASARSGYERCGIHASGEVTKLEGSYRAFCEVGGGAEGAVRRRVRVSTCSTCSLTLQLRTPIRRPFFH